MPPSRSRVYSRGAASGRIDLVVGNREQANELHHNDGNGVFTRIQGASWMTQGVLEYCQLGGEQILPAGWPTGQETGEVARCQQVMWSTSGRTNAIAFGDYDGDGFVDLIIGRGMYIWTQDNVMYRNLGVDASSNWLGFVPVANEFTAVGNQRRTTAIALGDLDGDGDLVTEQRPNGARCV